MRRLWRSLEAVHAVVYFAPEAATAYAEVGCRGWWMGYFASRAAALGPVGPDLVTALFFGFAPARVARALPAAWQVSSPAAVLAARYGLAALALDRVGAAAAGVYGASGGTDGLGPEWEEATAEAGELTARMVTGAPRAGRPLFASHAALPRPAGAGAGLWHDATALREFRGDGHVAALVAADLDGCSANALMVALGAVPPTQREHRGWSEHEWSAAHEALIARGWVTPDGTPTPAGWDAREEIEAATDRAARPALGMLDDRERARLAELLLALAQPIAAAAAVPYPNPTGVPAA